jgi:hypothetical protein
MQNKETAIEKEEEGNSSDQNMSLVEQQEEVAKHFEQASRHRRAAARAHEIGDHEKAYQHVLKSHEFANLASEAMRNESNQQALI